MDWESYLSKTLGTVPPANNQVGALLRLFRMKLGEVKDPEKKRALEDYMHFLVTRSLGAELGVRTSLGGELYQTLEIIVAEADGGGGPDEEWTDSFLARAREYIALRGKDFEGIEQETRRALYVAELSDEYLNMFLKRGLRFQRDLLLQGERGKQSRIAARRLGKEYAPLLEELTDAAAEVFLFESLTVRAVQGYRDRVAHGLACLRPDGKSCLSLLTGELDGIFV